VPDAGADGLDYPVYNAAANHRYGVASVGGGRRAAGIVFDSGRLYPAKSFRACRRGVRQPAADLLAFALALPMGLSVLKTFRSDAPTPAHTLREE